MGHLFPSVFIPRLDQLGQRKIQTLGAVALSTGLGTVVFYAAAGSKSAAYPSWARSQKSP